MFKNSDSDSDAEAGHMRSGRSFRKVPLANLFKQSYRPLAQDEDFYSGEEAGRSDEEYSEFSRAEEVETERTSPRRTRNFRDCAYCRSKYYYSSYCFSSIK
jgi:hypothetical protein